MKKQINVGDVYRTNPDSLIPGGSVVETHSVEGLVLVYDKIKKPNAYISKITKDGSIQRVFVDGELRWEKATGFKETVEKKIEKIEEDDLPF
jgi:hypothetical protein